MINLHVGRQFFDFDCGAQALQTVMAYYGVHRRADELIAALGSGPDFGTTVGAMVRVAEEHGFTVEVRSGWTLKELKSTLRAGHPVIVLVQAWADRFLTLEAWRENWDDGHYVIVIDHDKGVLLFEDPASFHRTWLREREFLARWHDRDERTGEVYRNFGMVLQGREPVAKTIRHMD
jgi:uncharacterized protein